jgi:hypothetical protein
MANNSGQEYLDKLDELIHKNKILWFFTIFQIIAILFLLIGYFSLKENIAIRVDLPPKIYQTGTLLIGSQKANDLYYKVWGQFAVEIASNYSPETVEKKYNQLSFLLNPEKVSKHMNKFLEKIQNVQRNLITHEFVRGPTVVKLFNGKNKANVKIVGIATKNVGNGLELEYELCEYNVGMSIDNYHLFIDAFREKCQTITKKQYDTKKSEIIIDRKYDDEYKTKKDK